MSFILFRLYNCFKADYIEQQHCSLYISLVFPHRNLRQARRSQGCTLGTEPEYKFEKSFKIGKRYTLHPPPVVQLF